MKDKATIATVKEIDEEEFLNFLNDHYKGLGISPKKTWGEKFNDLATVFLTFVTIGLFLFMLLYVSGIWTFTSKLIEVMSK